MHKSATPANQLRSGRHTPQHVTQRIKLLLTLLLLIILFFSTPLWLWAQSTFFVRAIPSVSNSHSVAWGDVDGDGDLDLAVGNVITPNEEQLAANAVYLNIGGDLEINPSWQSIELDHTTDLAWADVDGDGDLDLAVANQSGPNRLYLNSGGQLNETADWSSNDLDLSTSVSWGDVDGDGDFDLAVGNKGAPNKLYLNQFGSLTINAVWLSTDSDNTTDVAFGDADNDGNLDLAAANGNGQASKIYINSGFALETDASWLSSETTPATSLAWADINNDGRLDLAIGNGIDAPNTKAADHVYLNQLGGLPTTVSWASTFIEVTTSLAWGDVDNDGDLDLATGQFAVNNRVYLNNNGVLETSASIEIDSNFTHSLAWADIDNDGDLDLMVGNDGPNKIYFNQINALKTTLSQSISENDKPIGLAWGDVDGDGDLDLAVASGVITNVAEGLPNKVYENIDGQLQTPALWQSAEQAVSASVAWGDFDNDGDLDLAVGNGNVSGGGLEPNHIYRNTGQMLEQTAFWTSAEADNTKGVAWADFDNDGDLDLAAGNDGSPNRLYLNNNGLIETTASWQSSQSNDTKSLAWGDVDGDGDLDLAVGDWLQPNKIYLNINGTLEITASWQSEEEDATATIAWGDVDGDGDLDLAVGNDRSLPNRVYFNQNGALETAASWISDEANATATIAWADFDSDGDLDLAVGNGNLEVSQSNQIYINDNGNLETTASWASMEMAATKSLAWGDIDNDGDLEVAIGNYAEAQVSIYLNGMSHKVSPFQRLPALNIRTPSNTPWGQAYATPDRLDQTIIPILYTLTNPKETPVGRIALFYSLDGGDNWQTAAATNTQLINLATTAAGAEYRYNWHTFDSQIFGQSDNVVLRLVAYPQFPASQNNQTYSYPNQTSGPYQWPSVSATSYAFRLQGTQIRVVQDKGNGIEPVSGALVYRLPVSQITGADPIRNIHTHVPYRTDHNGYLQGRGELAQNDALLAMVPISATQNYTIYHTSGMPTDLGVDMQVVQTAGEQTLTIQDDNLLYLFNLVVSLEWDARVPAAEDSYIEQLTAALNRTSEIIYDTTNGQAALGDVHIYHRKGFWGHANVVIQANNIQRPSATLGGIVQSPINDIDANGITIEKAFIPGQIRMPPLWRRWGDGEGGLGEDWSRVLAHELGHYLFYVPDNYLGLENNHLTLIDCDGSIMADPYQYDEFLTAEPFNEKCDTSLAKQYLNRSDWETVSKFYPNINATRILTGPVDLPLNVTQVSAFAPTTPTTVIQNLFVEMVDQNSQPVSLESRQAQAYLIKTKSNTDFTDNYVVAQGSPLGARIEVRGADPNDRLCVFDYSQSPLRIGCIDALNATTTQVTLKPVPDWKPQIQVTLVNSHTVSISVTNTTDAEMMVQLLPAIGVASAPTAMIPHNSGFSQTISLPNGVYFGYVRLWVPGSSPFKEIVADYTTKTKWGAQGYSWGEPGYDWQSPIDGWGAQGYSWGAQGYSWGAQGYSWGAPLMSNDGQVMVFPLDDLFSFNALNFSLDRLTVPAPLPDWFTPVGQMYRFDFTGDKPDGDILFRYLARDVPQSAETFLQIYYSADNGLQWQPLQTIRDEARNHISASLQGAGIYALISTIQIPPFVAGCNTFGYPLQEIQPIDEALASIDGKYTQVAHFDPTSQPPWSIYNPTIQSAFKPMVNTLENLEFGKAYSIQVTEPVTLYLSTSVSQLDRQQKQAHNLLPPAIYYGWITPTQTFSPTVGMFIRARIEGQLIAQTTITTINGQLAYQLQVPNSQSTLDCEEINTPITFEIGPWIMDHDRNWDNQQATYHSLYRTKNVKKSIHLPIISK